jgi:hypothetical protein
MAKIKACIKGVEYLEDDEDGIVKTTPGANTKKRSALKITTAIFGMLNV